VDLNQIEIRKIRRSGIIASFVLLVVGTLHLLKGHTAFYLVLYSLGGLFCISAIFFTAILKKITQGIGLFITSLLLALIFYGLLTPLSLVMRLFGKDPLDKRIERHKLSYWVKREADSGGIERYQRQF
jgi:polyferredoxin